MGDAVRLFEEARQDDRVVSQEDLHAKLANLSVADWRAVTQTYDKTSDLVNNFYVEEKPDAFVVHNDQDAINDARVTSGAWGLVRGAATTGLGLGIGQFAMRYSPYGRIAGTALGLLSGILWAKHDSNHINHLQETSYPLMVPKSELKLD